MDEQNLTPQPPEEQPINENPQEPEVQQEPQVPQEPEAPQASQVQEEVPVDTEEKKGISKWILFAIGVVAIAVVVAVVMLSNNTWPFRGQLSEVIQEVETPTAPIEEVVRPAAEQLCPTNEYYDAETMASTEQETRLIDESLPDERVLGVEMIDTVSEEVMTEPTGEVRDETALEVAPLTVSEEVMTEPTGEVRDETALEVAPLTVSEEVMTEPTGEVRDETALEVAPLEAVTGRDTLAVPSFDASQCQRIDQTDCALIEKLKADPSAYYLSDETVRNLDEWELQYCAEVYVPVTEVPICAENQVVGPDNSCICSEGFFEIEPSAIDSVPSFRTLNCVSCEDIQGQIETLKSQLVEPNPLLDITEDQRIEQNAAIQSEIQRLEEKATEENCVTEEETFETELPAREYLIEQDSCQELTDRITYLNEQSTLGMTSDVEQEISSLTSQAEELGCEVPVQEVNECTQYEQSAAMMLDSNNLTGSYNQEVAMVAANCITTFDPCEEKIAYATLAEEYRDASVNEADRISFEEELQSRRDSYVNDPMCEQDTQSKCLEIENRTITDSQPVETMIDSTTRDNSLNQQNLNSAILNNIGSNSIMTDEEYYALYCEEVVTNEESTQRVMEGETTLREEESPAAAPPEEPSEEISPAAAPPEEPSEEISPAAAPPVEPAEPEDSAPVAIAPTEPTVEPTPAPVVNEPQPLPEITEDAVLHSGAPEEPATPETPLPTFEITEEQEIPQVGPEANLIIFMIIASQLIFFRRKIYDFIGRL